MKKKLEADLISIAHRILQLKNKSDINQLYLETQKLYEKLSVLRFVEEHFGDVKPTIGTIEIEKQIEQAFHKEESAQPEPSKVIDEVKEEEVAIETPLEQNTGTTGILQPATNIVVDEVISEEEVIETPLEEMEEIEELVTDGEILTDETIEPETAPFIPAFNLEMEEETEIEEPKKEEIEIEAPKKNEAVQISFEDLLGGNYHDTQFVKVQQIENIPTTIVIETPKEIDSEEKITPSIPEETPENVEPKIVSLNEKLAKGINIDLNDRIAFTKHLFGNSSEDYNRVLNQLITFDTFYETRDFILDMVKPDYNNWEGKEDYEERFMDIIEKKFL
jgi:hypothetical protein